MRLQLLAVVAGLAVVPAANASIVVSDILDLQVVGNGGVWNLADNTSTVTTFMQNTSGLWIIEGNVQTSDWEFDWGIEINQAGQSRGLDSASISTSFNFTNATGNDSAIFEVIANAVVGPLGSPTLQTGSVSGSVGSGNPVIETATLSTPAGDNLFTALVDGAGVQTLLDDSFSVSSNLTAPFGPATFLDQPGGAVLNTIGIRHSFGLTDGDNAGFVGVFVLNEVPAPGSAALIGLGAAFAGRRRR